MRPQQYLLFVVRRLEASRSGVGAGFPRWAPPPILREIMLKCELACFMMARGKVESIFIGCLPCFSFFPVFSSPLVIMPAPLRHRLNTNVGPAWCLSIIKATSDEKAIFAIIFRFSQSTD